MSDVSKLMGSMEELSSLYRDQRDYLSKEVEKLKAERNKYRDAILACLEKNRHLADGDQCTLIGLKQALL